MSSLQDSLEWIDKYLGEDLYQYNDYGLQFSNDFIDNYDIYDEVGNKLDEPRLSGRTIIRKNIKGYINDSV